MNAFAERIIFMMICIQIAINLVNMTQIIPGQTLTSGQVNNAFLGGLDSGPTSKWFTDSLTLLSNSFNSGTNVLNNFVPINFDIFDIGAIAKVMGNAYNLLLAIVITLFSLLLILISAIILLLTLLLGAISAGLVFWPAIISVIDAADAPFWGGLIGGLQTIIIFYAIGSEVLEILGSKGKSMATGGTAGQ